MVGEGCDRCVIACNWSEIRCWMVGELCLDSWRQGVAWSVTLCDSIGLCLLVSRLTDVGWSVRRRDLSY
jgi:hypothetical protein